MYEHMLCCSTSTSACLHIIVNRSFYLVRLVLSCLSVCLFVCLSLLLSLYFSLSVSPSPPFFLSLSFSYTSLSSYVPSSLTPPPPPLVPPKLHLEVPVADFKTMFGGRVRACFTGKDAVVRNNLCFPPSYLARGVLHVFLFFCFFFRCFY